MHMISISIALGACALLVYVLRRYKAMQHGIGSLSSWSSSEEVIRAVGASASDLSGSTCIITGCNTGIGKYTAKVICGLGAHTIMACRSLARAHEAAQEIAHELQKEQGNKFAATRLYCIVLDLSSSKSVRNFVAEFKKIQQENNLPPLQRLILNAGMQASELSMSDDAMEMSFASNHLGHFLFTDLLMEDLRAAAPARVIAVSSASHFGPLATSDVCNKEALLEHVVFPRKSSFGLLATYGSTKLCNVLFAQQLHKTDSVNMVAACSLHPGNMIATDFQRNSAPLKLLSRVISPFTKSMSQGAATTILCALCPHRMLQGNYFENCQQTQPSKLAQGPAGEEAAGVLWTLSEELCQGTGKPDWCNSSDNNR